MPRSYPEKMGSGYENNKKWAPLAPVSLTLPSMMPVKMPAANDTDTTDMIYV